MFDNLVVDALTCMARSQVRSLAEMPPTFAESPRDGFGGRSTGQTSFERGGDGQRRIGRIGNGLMLAGKANTGLITLC